MQCIVAETILKELIFVERYLYLFDTRRPLLHCKPGDVGVENVFITGLPRCSYPCHVDRESALL